MRYSKAFIYTSKNPPKDAENISTALLTRAGFINKLASGVYSFLPLGWKVSQKISQIIREELDKIGAQELCLPVMHPKELWEETGRWKTIDPPLFKFKDRHNKEYALGSTHEEVLSDIVRNRISSWQDLPQNLYQIQVKFRNELRATSGLLRTREFMMLDSYSFHADSEDLKAHYQQIVEAFRKIFQRCHLNPVLTEASSGSIGGTSSHEFILPAQIGEDKFYRCENCKFAANSEIFQEKKCPKCGNELKEEQGIELGHIFFLDDLYSKKMGALFADKDNQKKPILMGCYGIGIGRLLASVVETHHDEAGMIWPPSLVPYQVYLIDLTDDKAAEKIYHELEEKGIEVLFDDRETSAGIKFADADLLGLPMRIVVSPKTLASESVEVQDRKNKKIEIIKIEDIVNHCHGSTNHS